MIKNFFNIMKHISHPDDSITISRNDLSKIISSIEEERTKELRAQFLNELKNEEYYTKKQSCLFLNVARRELTKMTRDGVIEALYVGNHPMYKASDVKALIEKKFEQQ